MEVKEFKIWSDQFRKKLELFKKQVTYLEYEDIIKELDTLYLEFKTKCDSIDKNLLKKKQKKDIEKIEQSLIFLKQTLQSITEFKKKWN